jgi:hypothetical protein
VLPKAQSYHTLFASKPPRALGLFSSTPASGSGLRAETPFLHPRFISKEILTIREAVWLTDNTYKYEDLVRMMGEIVSALEGKIRVSRSFLLPVESKLLLCLRSWEGSR